MARQAARLEGHACRGEGDGDDPELIRVDGLRRVERDPDQRAGAPIAPGRRAGQDPQAVRGIDDQVLRKPETPGQDLRPVPVGERELAPAPQRPSAPVLGGGAAGRDQEQEDRRERQLMKRS